MKTTWQLWTAAALAALVWGTACGTSEQGSTPADDTSQQDTGTVDTGEPDTTETDTSTEPDVVPGCIPGSEISQTVDCPDGSSVSVMCECVDGVHYACEEGVCPGPMGCSSDDDCAVGVYCDPCGISSCPDCDDCVPACVAHRCDTEDEAHCYMEPPECQPLEDRYTDPIIVRVVRDECWDCVDLATCGETPDYCGSDYDCVAAEYCDPCATSSCPECEDCVPACVPHGCPTEGEALCDMIRPDCGPGEVAVIDGGCWSCVAMDACEPDPVTCEELGGFCASGGAGCPPDTGVFEGVSCEDGSLCCDPGTTTNACDEVWGHCMPYDDAGSPMGCEHGFQAIRTTCSDGERTCCAPLTYCDDGSEVMCWGTPPYCDEPQIPALIEGCWQCVDPDTCEPPTWGTELCESSSECAIDEWCNPCGTSSCPDCDDCRPACTTHRCPTETELTCRMMRPDCDAGEVSVVVDGCWECVELATCDALEPTCDEVGGFCSDLDIGCPADTTASDATCERGGQCCVADPMPTMCEDIGGTCVGGVGGCPRGTHATTDGMCMILGDCCVPDEPASACDEAYGHCMPDTGMCEPGFEPIRTTCDTGATCCAPVTTCNDGTELRCDEDVPFCGPEEVPAIRGGCWACVNAVTCLTWGTPECRDGRDCPAGEICDDCATSSCPMCDDCVAACVAD